MERDVDPGEWEDWMNEHEKDAGRAELGTPLDPGTVEDRWSVTRERDMVLDLSGTRELDAATLSLLLTAQQSALKEDRAVWLAGVPQRIWDLLLSMGLGTCFRPFPQSRDREM